MISADINSLRHSVMSLTESLYMMQQRIYALESIDKVQAPPKPMHWVNPPPEVESVDTYGELCVKEVPHKKYGDVVKLPVGYPKYLRVTGTSKSGMWYQKLIGKTVPFEGIWPDGFKSREPTGYVNIVYFADAIIVPGQAVCEIHEEILPCASCLENAVKRAVRS